jgi:eukaryotic-like serine/threonine-protein kinase
MAVAAVSLTAMTGISFGPLGGQLGPYRLLERIGEGAYATVYRALHEVMGVERAVKMSRPLASSGIRPPTAGLEPLARFFREARVVARLNHRNVIGVYDCGTTREGVPYLVMEYVAGTSLADRMRAGVPPPAETLHIASQLAAALDYVHQRGVVHRDVKPANVILGEEGRVCLGDFGIAYFGAEPDADEPWAGLGTPTYMAPEQCSGERSGQGPHTDIYALAVMLYEMLTGRTPVADGRGALDYVPPPPGAVNPYLPEAVNHTISSGMARDPSLRPVSAGALVADLSAALIQPSPPLDRVHSRSFVIAGNSKDRPTSPSPLPREVPPPAREAPPSRPRLPVPWRARSR